MNISFRTLKGGTALVFDSVEGITSTVERMHETIAAPPLPGLWRRPGAHGVIAASVYSAIKGTNGLLRGAADRGLGLLSPGDSGPISAAETRALAALNGAVGDYLESSGNDLALPMTLHADGETLSLDSESPINAPAAVRPHLVIFVHGLGLSEYSWSAGGDSIGDHLAQSGAFTPLYLRYNTGRHISTNGQEFAGLLEALCAAWPVPVESVSLVGHSMGGLVIRSACWYAEQQEASWMSRLQRVVCLGTPHHGAPLERAGHALDLAMRRIPYVEPLAFGRHRSAGIKDLRFGNLLDEDWQGCDPDQHVPDSRRPVPLLPGVEYYFVAAALGRSERHISTEILGDLLVRLDSAVGSHHDDLKHLNIKPDNCRVFLEKNHFDLQSDERVHEQILDWFCPGGVPAL